MLDPTLSYTQSGWIVFPATWKIRDLEKRPLVIFVFVFFALFDFSCGLISGHSLS